MGKENAGAHIYNKACFYNNYTYNINDASF